MLMPEESESGSGTVSPINLDAGNMDDKNKRTPGAGTKGTSSVLVTTNSPEGTTAEGPDDSSIATSTANINQLATGLLESCETELTQVNDELREFTSRQQEILGHLNSFNDDFASNPELQQLKSVMEEMNQELNRLGNIRHEMNSVHDKAEKLKMRAEKLKGIRVSRERREEELVAKLDVDTAAASTSSSSEIVGSTNTTNKKKTDEDDGDEKNKNQDQQ